MKLDLEGKLVFASASTDGLGFAIAAKALEDGASVFIGGRSKERLDTAIGRLAEIAKISGGVYGGALLDMSSSASIESWVAEGKRSLGEPWGLIVNAGGPPPGDFESFTGDDPWYAAFELTLMSAVRLIRATLPSIRKNAGSILTITSSSVKEPWPGLILSGIMRSGVASLVKSLSVELANSGVRVNNIAPGNIYTGRLEKLIATEAAMKDISSSEQRAFRESNIPLGRIGDVQEFGRAGAFLLSPAASYISGQTLLVDGAASKFLY
jgi:3-oxoacyl-[acyl-carrier protein] reductase